MSRKLLMPVFLLFGGFCVAAIVSAQEGTSRSKNYFSGIMNGRSSGDTGQSSKTTRGRNWGAGRKMRSGISNGAASNGSKSVLPESEFAPKFKTQKETSLKPESDNNFPSKANRFFSSGLVKPQTRKSGEPWPVIEKRFSSNVKVNKFSVPERAKSAPPFEKSVKSSAPKRNVAMSLRDRLKATQSEATVGRLGGSRVKKNPFNTNSNTNHDKVRRPFSSNSTTIKPPKIINKQSYKPRATITPGIRSTGILGKASPRIGSETGVLFTTESPQVSVRTIGPKQVMIGKTATYTIEIQNTGRITANGIAVSIDTPNWAEVRQLVASQGKTEAPRDGTSSQPHHWRVSSLAPGEKQKLTVNIIPRRNRPFELGVRWSFTPDPSVATVEVQEPKLQIAVFGAEEMLYGKTAIYRVTVSNPGTGVAEKVSVLFDVPGQSASVTQRHEIGDIAAGQSRVISVKLTASQAGTLLLKASAKGEGELTAVTAQHVLVRRAELQVKVGGPKFKYAGTVATYKIRITNPGNAVADSVKITTTLPTGAKFVTSTDAGMLSGGGSKVSWNVDSLQPGTAKVVSLKCILNAPDNNRLQVTSTATGDLADSSAVITRVETVADLKLEVSDPTGPIAVGENVVYEVKIRNRGTKRAEGVQVVAYFSKGIEPIKASGAEHDIQKGQVTFMPLPVLAAGSEIILKITAKAELEGDLVFRAKLTCREPSTELSIDERTKFYVESVGDEPEEDDDVKATSDSGTPTPLYKP